LDIGSDAEAEDDDIGGEAFTAFEDDGGGAGGFIGGGVGEFGHGVAEEELDAVGSEFEVEPIGDLGIEG